MYRNQSYQSWGNRQQNRQNQQNRPYQESYQYTRNEYYPENYRGEYRFDERDNYQSMNRQNFEENPRYSHPSGFRSDRDFQSNRRRQDFYQNQNPSYRNREERGNYSNYNADSSYGASRNYGSMGSYGGAQGYGSSSNGYNADGWGSGHRGASFQPHHTVYGAYRDRNSFAEGEQPSYDGSQRYGSQGADNTPASRRQSRHENYTGRSTNNQNDDRYEIYDTALSQYNRGDYGNPSQGSMSDRMNPRSHQEYSTRHNYGSRQRSRNRQGSGSDQEYGGTSDLGYNSVGEPFYRSQPDYVSAPQNRYFDSNSGQIRNSNY